MKRKNIFSFCVSLFIALSEIFIILPKTVSLFEVILSGLIILVSGMSADAILMANKTKDDDE